MYLAGRLVLYNLESMIFPTLPLRGTNPRKRRAQSGCSLIELQNNKRVIINFNFVTPNSNSSKLLDRISTPFIGSSENHQL
ncbi:hypothetical protein H4Q26_012502 [Puccinia striiformis f. sp. tritici PST-130]|nr:hypothetical protein H4Q26_012502 [Puccinia striiformis f. sp. tritici PST-130]